METRGDQRRAAAAGTSTTHDQYLGLLHPELEPVKGSQLPTNGDVLRHYFYLKRGPLLLQDRESVITIVIKKVQLFWDSALIPVTPLKGNISRELFAEIFMKFENMKRHKNRKGKITAFNILCDQLFDISHVDAEHLINTDRLRTEADKEEDKAFLHDQRTTRLQCLGAIDRHYTKKVESKLKRAVAEEKLQIQEAKTQKMLKETTSDFSAILSDETSSSSDSSSEEFKAPSPQKKKRMNSNTVDILKSPEFNKAADRFGLSLRGRFGMAGVIHRVCGTDLDTVNCSVMTAKRFADTNRKEAAELIKVEFVPPPRCAIHWDGKKVKNNCGASGKVERLVISASGPPDHTEGKFLHAAKIATLAETGVRMGKAEALVVYDVCKDWNILANIWAMVFDTTATNSGHINGACTIFEKDLLRKKVLWAACNHHKDEVVLHDVVKCLFGETSSPQNPVFVHFRDVCWPQLDTSGEYKALDIQERHLKTIKDKAVDIYMATLTTQNNKGDLPREDYRECTEVMLMSLGVDPPRGCRWYKPQGTSNTRWMSDILYCGKIVAFSDQLELEEGLLRLYIRFLRFCALFYVPWWLAAARGIDSPVNDLEFWNDMKNYMTDDPEVADAAITALERHLWYVTEEMAPLSLFSEKVSNGEKSQIARQILKQKRKYRPHFICCKYMYFIILLYSH